MDCDLLRLACGKERFISEGWVNGRGGIALVGYAGRGKELELLCPFCEGNKVSTFLFLYEKNNLNYYIIYKYIKIYIYKY